MPATLQQLETALINADRAGDDESAAILAAEIRRMRGETGGAAGGQRMSPADEAQFSTMLNDPRVPAADVSAFAQAKGGFTVAPQEVDAARVEAKRTGQPIGINYPTPAVTEKPKPVEVPFTEAFGRGVEATKLNAYGALTNAMRKVGVLGEPSAEELIQRQRFEEMYGPVRAAAQEQHPFGYAGGNILADIALTEPLVTGTGGLIRNMAAHGAQRNLPGAALLEQFGRNVQTGGIGSGRTAAETMDMSGLQRFKDLVVRSAAGGLGGAEMAAVLNQDAGVGGAFGAAIPVLGSVLTRLGGRAIDIGRMPRREAAELMRRALGENEDAARAALASLSPDDQRLARQALVEMGIEPRAFMALGERAEQQLPDVFHGTREAQRAAYEAELARHAGGTSAAETAAAAREGRKAVSTAIEPDINAALARSNVAGERVPAAVQKIENELAAAQEKSALARRMVLGSARAEERAGLMGELPGTFGTEAMNRERGLAGAMEQRGATAAKGAISARAAAQDAEDEIAFLAMQGMKPMESGPISARLRATAGSPGIRASTAQRRSLIKLANEVDRLGAINNGIIDSRDLYQLRKTEANDVIKKLLAGADVSSGTKRSTAKRLGEFKELIDDTIEASGGIGWKDTMKSASEQYAAVNRQELMGDALKLFQENPKKFERLMRGNEPDMVETRLGIGQDDIRALAQLDPEKFAALSDAAKFLKTEGRVKELAGQGTTVAGDVLGGLEPTAIKRATRMLAPVGAAIGGAMTGGVGGALGAFALARNQMAIRAAEEAAAAATKPKVMRALAEGFTSPSAALNLMNTYPSGLMMAERYSKFAPNTQNAMAAALRSSALNFIQR